MSKGLVAGLSARVSGQISSAEARTCQRRRPPATVLLRVRGASVADGRCVSHSGQQACPKQTWQIAVNTCNTPTVACNSANCERDCVRVGCSSASTQQQGKVGRHHRMAGRGCGLASANRHSERMPPAQSCQPSMASHIPRQSPLDLV